MALIRAGMRSLAVAFPETVRTNNYWRRKWPELVATAEGRTLSKLWSPGKGGGGDVELFDREMMPYVADPFRGSIERRVLAPGQTSLQFEIKAAQRAIAAAGLDAKDIDLVICSAFFPDQIDVGNGAFVVGALGLKCAAWNLETACSSSLVAFRTACAIVGSGQQKNVLCVVSCNYSQVSDVGDTFSWFLGDGAAAFVVSATADGAGLLGSHAINTADTCGAFFQEMVPRPDGKLARRIRSTEKSGKSLRDTAGPFLRDCVDRALDDAGVGLDDISLFVFNTPTAWYSAFCAKVLGIDHERTINTYPTYANTGPVLMPTNLHHAARAGRVKKGELALLYSVGSVSTAAAAIVKWGDFTAAPETDPPTTTE